MKTGSIAQRQALFLESVERAAPRADVHLVAVSDNWSRPGWDVRPTRRNASAVGDTPLKPFLRDLLDQAFELAQGDDWLFCCNVDCPLAPDFYEDLASRRATVVEYMRQDIDGEPATLEEVFTFPRENYWIGLDGFAFRAGFYREIRPNFPDFILGEPHWDTALTGLLRNFVPVQRDLTRMFHPKHQQAWNLAKLTPAGTHNDRIYKDALMFGYCEEPTIGPVSGRTDTAVVLCIFGDDPARIEANATAVCRQLDQDLWTDTYLVELLPPGKPSTMPDHILSKVHHIRVDCPPEAEGFFQKEALQNIGWKTALERHRYEYLIFVDADVYANEPDWFRRIRAKLQADPSRAVQGFKVVTDSADSGFQWASLASMVCIGRHTDLPPNPGICWGLHRELLTTMQGFNPFSLASSGDSLFVSEVLSAPDKRYDPWLGRYSWFYEVLRDLPVYAEMDCVDVELVHQFHGPFVERNYNDFRLALTALGPVSNWLALNEAGLVVWKNPNGVERRLYGRRAEMTSKEAVRRIVKEMGIDRPVVELGLFEPRPKPRFTIPDWAPPQNIIDSAIPQRQPRGGNPRVLEMFDPRKLYRKSFPFSWVGNAKRTESDHALTGMRDGVPSIIIEPVEGATWVALMLPVESNWQPVDLSKHSKLQFTYKALDEDLKWSKVELAMEGPDGKEFNGLSVFLQPLGLESAKRMDFEIPLKDLVESPEHLEIVRLVRWTAAGSMRFELSQVRIV